MIKINIYTIEKKSKDRLYSPLIEHYKKMLKGFAKVETFDIFSREIQKAHDISTQASQKSYTMTFNKFLSTGYNIALDPNSRLIDSYEFSDLFKNRGRVNLFIGGAFGLEKGFLDKCNSSISFGKITLSHKLTKVVLLEQIFRALSILNNHPYHK
jgi:23S rRNA (pseudouridine1915-N3)-methyltransferase